MIERYLNRDGSDRGGNAMFVASCLSCGRRELRGYSGIQAVVNGDRSWEVHFICRACGGRALADGSDRIDRAAP
jgi:hypothetical protein